MRSKDAESRNEFVEVRIAYGRSVEEKWEIVEKRWPVNAEQ